MRRAIGVEDEAGQRVDGEVEVGDPGDALDADPVAAVASRCLSLVASPIVEDLAGNRIGTAFEIDVFDTVDQTTAVEELRIPFEIR